eukprot:6515340-Pyramimonas_sp.AAC.1
MPEEFNIMHWLDPDSFNTVLTKVSTCTFMPMADRASSNMGILKPWGSKAAEIVEQKQANTNAFNWPDTCGIHAHHRGKLK